MGGEIDKCFPKWSSGRSVWRSAEKRKKKKVFEKLDFIGTVVSIDKIENLRERNKQLLIFKYAESYGS